MASQDGALVVGAGALGTAAALALAGAGLRRVVLVDGGRVEPADPYGAPLLTEADVGAPRAGAAAARLHALFPGVEVEALDVPLTPANAPVLAGEAAVVLAAADDLGTQFLAGDAALRAGAPLVAGGALRTTLQLLTVRPGGEGACLRCLHEGPPAPGTVPSAREAGLLSPVGALAGVLMGAEAMRVLTAERGAYQGRLVAYEARSGQSRVVAVSRRPGCPACEGQQPLEAPGGGAPVRREGQRGNLRQRRVPGFGEAQDRLEAVTVRVVGGGRAAGQALLALVQAGVRRIWIDDPDAGEAGAAAQGWIPCQGSSGPLRGASVIGHLGTAFPGLRVERYPPGGVPAATLVCARNRPEALAAAEQARRAGIPHVVQETEDAGPVVTIPPGSPCHSCATSEPSGQLEAGGDALPCLAALELVLLVAAPAEAAGRRIELVGGLPVTRSTVRLPGCRCGTGGR